MACSLLLTDGSYLLLTDGSSHLLLAECEAVETPAQTGHGAGGGPSAWYYKKLAERKKRLREEEYQRRLSERYAQQLAAALERAKAEDAERLAESAKRLEKLLAESDFARGYLLSSAAGLIASAMEAADLARREAERRVIEARMREAALIARRIEEELIDEEETIFLLLMD